MNPNAPEFNPVYSDKHCLYLTLSNGNALTESQVFNFFNRTYKPYVEGVYLHRKRGQPWYGRVVFKTSEIPNIVMGNEEKVIFNVEGRPLYCKRFVSKNKTAATASNSSGDGGSHHGGDE